MKAKWIVCAAVLVAASCFIAPRDLVRGRRAGRGDGRGRRGGADCRGDRGRAGGAHRLASRQRARTEAFSASDRSLWALTGPQLTDCWPRERQRATSARERSLSSLCGNLVNAGVDRPSAWQDVNAEAFTQCGAPASLAFSTPAPAGQETRMRSTGFLTRRQRVCSQLPVD